MDQDPVKVGRRFSGAATELALSSYAGFFTTTPPTNETAYGVYWPALVPADAVHETVTIAGQTTPVVRPASARPGPIAVPDAPPPWDDDGTTERLPLGTVCGARSGDKGGNANIGVWARGTDAHRWLHTFLTVDRLRALLPETADLTIERFELPNLLALNFVVTGLLGRGVASSSRYDAQAKGLGEHLRSRLVDIPSGLVAGRHPKES
jgi:hypothetical protein